MPRIDTNARRITTSPVTIDRRQQVSPDAFGAGLGEEIQRTAGVLRQMEGQTWDRANRAKVDGAAATLAAKRLELDTRIRAAKGEQAFALADTIESEFDEAVAETSKGLANDAQRDAFTGDAQRLSLGLRESLGRHLAEQGEMVAQQKADARASTMFQSAIANRHDEGMAWQDLMDAQATLETYDRSIGVPQEARDARQQALRSKFTADTIEAFADEGNHLAAAKWLEGYRGQLKNPADMARAERATKSATMRGESQRLVDGILARPDSTIDTAMAEAAKIQDPELRAAVEDRAVRMLNLREKAHEDAQVGLFADLYKRVKDDPRGLDALKDSELQALDPARREQLEMWAKREERAETKGQSLPWQVSKAIRYQIEAEAATPEGRAKFLGTDLRALLTQVNEDDFNALSNLQQKIRETGATGTEAAWLTSREDVVNQALAGQNIDPRPYITKDGETTPNEAAIGFRNAVEQEALAVAVAGGRTKPTVEDVRKAVDQIQLRKVYLREWGTDPERIDATLTTEQRATAYIPLARIPAGSLQAIRDRAAGRQLDDEQIERIYYLATRKDDAGIQAIIDSAPKE